MTDVTNVIYDYIYFANADASEIYYNITPSGSWSNDVNIIMSNYDLPSEVYLFVRPKRKTNNVAMSGTIKFQLEVGETATTYEPYTESNDITIQFGQTVHGGQIDVERGKLVIDKAHVDMGDLTWNHADTDTSGIRRMRGVGIENLIKKPTSSTSKANIISSLYATLTASQVYHMNVGVACDSDGSINVYDTNYNTTSSVSAFTTFVTGQDLVYTLATPIEVTLTPYQVTLLKNANYLSSTGDTITVTYRNGVVATLADLTSIPHKTSELFNDDYTVKDADYNTFTTAEKTKLSGISTDATKTQSSTTNGNIKIDGTETKVYDDSEIKTELSTDTTEIEGNPISFSTLTAQNASECIIDLDPIQDLHGYDKPWVGGAGKNKLPMVLADIKSINTLGTWSGNVYTYYDTAFTILTDTDDNVIGIKVTGTPTGTAVLRIIGNTINLPSGSYTMNGCPSGGDWSNKYALNFNYDSEAHVDVGSGTAITITSETVQTRVEVLIRNGFAIPTGGITFYPMIRLASVTDATFEPYTNYASITGRTEIGIEGCGKNLLPMVLANIKSENTDGTWNGNVYSQSGLTFEVKTDSTNNVIGILVKGTATTTVYFSCDSLFTLPNGSYIKSGCPSGGSGSTYFIGGSNSGNNDTGSGATFTSSGANTRFVIVINNGYAIATNGLLFQPMCRLASISDSSFAPYTPSNDLNIQFGQTVYGASLDVKRGVLTVNYELKTYSGQVSEGWETLLNNNFYIHRILRDVRYKTFNDNETSISNMFTNNHSSSNLSDSVYYVGNSFVAIAYNEITTNENWLTYLASNNLQVCYELATPTVIQLTPHEVNLLKGANYISTDGDKITIEYRTGEVATLGDVKEQIEEGKLHQYSTEEKVVAKWIDGRLIYEKTIRLGGMTLDQNWHPINTGISNLDFIISIIGIAFNDNDSEWYPINLQRPGGGAVMLLATKTQINYMNTYNDEISDSYVTMRYVKTS